MILVTLLNFDRRIVEYIVHIKVKIVSGKSGGISEIIQENIVCNLLLLLPLEEILKVITSVVSVGHCPVNWISEFHNLTVTYSELHKTL